MLTFEELTNARIKTRRRNRHFIYGTAIAFGLLGALLGSGWLFVPNIVPFLAGSALLIGSPLTVMLFGLAGIALGLFAGKQLINLGRSLLHVLHGEKQKRSWLRIGFAIAAVALMTVLLTTGALPIAATGFAHTAIATAIVLSSMAFATFLAKHVARGYAYFTEKSRDTRGYVMQRDHETHEAYVQKVTNPAKQNFTATELNNLQHTLDKSNALQEQQAAKVLRRLNQKITEAKWQGDDVKEAEAKAARDLLHFAAGESVDVVKANRRIEEVRSYATQNILSKAAKFAELNKVARDTIREQLVQEHANQKLNELEATHHLDRTFFHNPIGYSLHVLGLFSHWKEDLAKERAKVREEWHMDYDAFQPLLLSPPIPKQS